MAMAMELLAAFNELTERMGEISTASSSQLLFNSLRLSFPLLQALPNAADGTPLLSRASAVAYLLADLQMDAEVVSASLLREVLWAGTITLDEVESQIGSGTSHLLRENLLMKDMHREDEALDDDSASNLREQCLTSYDIRAIILELAVRLDMMRHLEHLTKYRQQKVSLEALKIYAPLAHAVGAAGMSLELEDLSFRYLFPSSYLYLDTWLTSRETESKPLIGVYKDQLLQALKSDGELDTRLSDTLVADISMYLGKGYIRDNFGCQMEVGIATEKVAFYAKKLFDVEVESKDGVRYIRYPGGSKAEPDPCIKLRACRREAILDVFGDNVELGFASAPIWEREEKEMRNRTDGVSLTITNQEKEAGKISLFLGAYHAFNIKRQLYD